MSCNCRKEKVKVQIQKLYEDVKLPEYAHDGDSGMDVLSRNEETLLPKETALFPLGFKVGIPEGYEIQVRSKSGLSLKMQLVVLNSPGTIDSNYRGECGVIVHNSGKDSKTINVGDKIAQIVLTPVNKCLWEEVEDLDETSRGSGGYGSTGLKG